MTLDRQFKEVIHEGFLLGVAKVRNDDISDAVVKASNCIYASFFQFVFAPLLFRFKKLFFEELNSLNNHTINNFQLNPLSLNERSK